MLSSKPKIFMLAPMAELSHRALRELIIEFEENHEGESLPPNSSPGANAVSSVTPFCVARPPQIIYVTEMISAAGLLSGGPFEQWYLDNGPCPDRLVYQLVGADETQLARAAAILDKEECLGIDLNMGCAAPAITRTGAGVRWMEDPEKAARLVEQIRRVTKKQLSAKIRLGPKNSSLRPGSAAPPLAEPPEQAL
jgi:tRNA-dihydrouridine synthase